MDSISFLQVTGKVSPVKSGTSLIGCNLEQDPQFSLPESETLPISIRKGSLAHIFEGRIVLEEIILAAAREDFPFSNKLRTFFPKFSFLILHTCPPKISTKIPSKPAKFTVIFRSAFMTNSYPYFLARKFLKTPATDKSSSLNKSYFLPRLSNYARGRNKDNCTFHKIWINNTCKPKVYVNKRNFFLNSYENVVLRPHLTLDMKRPTEPFSPFHCCVCLHGRKKDTDFVQLYCFFPSLRPQFLVIDRSFYGLFLSVRSRKTDYFFAFFRLRNFS